MTTTVNFEIEHHRDILFQEQLLDLHNHFDFRGVSKSPESIEILFEKDKNAQRAPEDIQGLSFFCRRITYLFERTGSTDAYPVDEKILRSITFFPNDMREESDSMTDQRIPDPDDDLIFCFEDDSLIRLQCEEVELVIS